MISCRTAKGRGPSGVAYSLDPIGVSMKTSSVSAPVVVKVQAISRLRPSTTNGTPGAVAPTRVVPGVSIRARYQMPGKLNARCGSPASNGDPVALCAASTAQALEAVPGWVYGAGKRG